MKTEDSLLKAIRDDFSDLDRQLVYADYLGERSGSVLEPYVRLMVLLQQTPVGSDAYCDIQSQRFKHLEAEPSRWQWDNFLSLRNLTTYGPEIKKYAFESINGRIDGERIKKSPADIASVEQLELKLGCALPTSYRAFLTELSDGSRLLINSIDFQPVFYSVADLEEILDQSKILTRARARSTLAWRKCVYDWDANDDQLAEMYECPPGFLPIAAHPMGQSYIVLNGEMRGTLWFRGDHDILYSLYALQEKYSEHSCSDQVKSLPVDAITAIRDMVIGRYKDLAREGFPLS